MKIKEMIEMLKSDQLSIRTLRAENKALRASLGM